jgi:phenylacetate-CoA ligase
MMRRLKSAIEQYRRRRILNYLKNVSPEKLESFSVKNLMTALRRAIKRSPAYTEILRTARVKYEQIKTLDDFRNLIPVLNKENYFNAFTLSQLLGKHENHMKLAMSSSGYSGSFAYGFLSEHAVKSGRTGVDATFDYWFGISDRKTFLINCAPMGVHVETSMPFAETSVRSDMALALLNKVSPAYDQTIIGGDPFFLKKLIDEGDEQGIPWSKLNVSLITAQDWLPETLRSYLADRLEIDPDQSEWRNIYASMGMTELGLNIFHESKYTLRLRRLMQHNEHLRNTLSGIDTMKAPPSLFHYYPFMTFIETANEELLFSNVSGKAILPLLRYATGDRGSTITYRELVTLLSGRYTEFIPDLKLPLGIFKGRMQNRITVNDSLVHVEDIKEGLFSDIESASNCTGLIRIGKSGNDWSVVVQLKRNAIKNSLLEKKLHNAINGYLPVELQVKLILYDENPALLELNYEKKFTGF